MVRKVLSSYDYSLLIAPIILAIFGVIMVYSASMVVAVVNYDGTPDLFFKKQLTWFFVSLVVFFITAFLPYKLYLHLLKPIVFLSIGSLIYVLVLGKIGGNARSWIELGPLVIQPAEFVKLGLIMYLAGVFSRKQSYIESFTTAVFPPLLYTIFIFVLVFKQPDLGTGLIILSIAFLIIACSGIRMKHLLSLIAIGLVGILMLVPFLSSEQISRLFGFTNPFNDIQGEGYQLVNSYLAIGSGGLWGQGLGKSVQKFGYLPEPHTDFIMAVIAEELGVMGVGFVIFVLCFIVIRGLRVARKCLDPFGSLLAIGISSMIGIQSFINLGALTGILPITGVPLPFVSYGGSSLVLLMISMGILVNVSMFVNLKEKKKQQTEQLQNNSYGA